MAVEKKQSKSPSAFDIVVAVIGAVTATISAIRAGQGALKAWRRVYADVRGEPEKNDE
jgi:hypothetical protein